ncbi:MAG: MFS transporter [Thermoplasmata archaeon]
MNEEQKTVLVLSVIVYLVMLGITIIAPVLPSYAAAFGASVLLIGVLVGSFAVARVFLDLPAGIFGDKFGNRRIMSIGLLIICGASLVAGFALNYFILLIARILEGIGSAFYATMSTSYLAKNTRIERRGRYMGVYVGALLLGQVSGPAIGGILAVSFGLNSPFLFYSLVTGIGFLILRTFIRRDEAVFQQKPEKGRLVRNVKTVLSNPSFLLVNVGTLAAFFGRAGVIATLFPLLASRNFGYDTDTVGLVLSGVALMSLATMLPSGIIADRIGRKIPFAASLILGGIAALFVPMASDLAGLTLAMLFFGLSLGLSGPMAAWAADLSEPRRMGTAMGVYRSIGDAGFLLGPVILTAIAGAVSVERITVLPFIVCSFWLIVSGVLLLRAEDPAGKRVVVAPAV